MIAIRVVELLRRSNDRLVLAESCTGGLVASQITQIEGVSDCFCGSAVTYLDTLKIDWLGVDKLSIDGFTAVSSEVACQMTEGAINRTREATVAASITGHLGPGAPANLDGTVFVAFIRRGASSRQIKVERYTLSEHGRIPRQKEAADVLLTFVCKQLNI